jgi:hypothetical protein
VAEESPIITVPVALIVSPLAASPVVRVKILSAVKLLPGFIIRSCEAFVSRICKPSFGIVVTVGIRRFAGIERVIVPAPLVTVI